MTSYLPLLTDDEMGAAGEAGVGAVATERGNLPLQAIDVDATLTGLAARVALTQTFGNRFDQPLEATYIFPLPDRAAVTEFHMEVGERVVEGVLKERGQARAEYDAAVEQGRRASIAEEERPGVFTMRVGNLLPGERVTVRLVMTGPLPWDEGEATFRFPLVVAPRYIPGSPSGGRAGRAGHRTRHRRGARRLPDHPPGAAARLPQPGRPVDQGPDRPGRPRPGRPPLQPARGGRPRTVTAAGWSGSSRGSGPTATSCSGPGPARRP